jgi:hypothetical protein
MKLMNALRIPLFAAALAAAPAFAAGDQAIEHAEKVLDGAKTTLSQAISTAEGEVGGRALSAHLARYHHQDFYDVHVIKAGEITDVRIAIDDGKIVSSHPMEHGHLTKAKPAAPQKPEQPGNKS